MPHFKEILLNLAAAIGRPLLVQKVIGIIECEKLEITISGGDAAKKIFNRYSSPHRKFPFVGSKTLGVALAAIPEKSDDIFKGKSYHEARRKRNRARRQGFECKKVPSTKYLDDIYAIHTSASIRQNRPVADDMLDKGEIQKFFEEHKEIYGVFDRHGVLKAYATGIIGGEALVLRRCIGHYDSLKYGIMFLLVFKILADMVKHRQLHGFPRWIQHDMYFVRTAGARQFKKEAGFRPYRVKWRWSDKG